MGDTTVKHLIHHAWAIGLVPEAVVSVLQENDIAITVELVRDLYAKWNTEVSADAAPCNHEWTERGDESTANFSMTCNFCGANGLI